jgi:GTP cyclohydrolase II
MSHSTHISIRQRVSLPMDGQYPGADFVSFDGIEEGLEHIALVFGVPSAVDPVLVRVHSECLTGDVFGSLRCDCGSQLKESVSLLTRRGGILLYLRQEGRGIGLYAKLDAYRLQDKGADTFEANRMLNFADDLRSYKDAAGMLKALNATSIRLITNNPDKSQQLEQQGIAVQAVINTSCFANEHNWKYLHAKKTKHEHAMHMMDF